MKYVIPRCEKYLAYWKDVLIKRLKDAMSITDRIQKNTNWIKLDKDILLYYFEVGDLFWGLRRKKISHKYQNEQKTHLFYYFKEGDVFYNYENTKLHISTKIWSKHTSHKDILKEFNNNPRRPGNKQKEEN